MTFKPRTPSPTLSVILLSLILAGCASEKTLLSQTQPLQTRIDQVEQHLTSNSAENQRVLAAQAERLATRQYEMAQQLADLKKQLTDMQSQSDSRQQNNNDALLRLAAQDEKLGYRLDSLQRDLADAAALAQNNAAQQTAILARQERDAALAAANATTHANANAASNAATLAEAQARIDSLKQSLESNARRQGEQLNALQQQTASQAQQQREAALAAANTAANATTLAETQARIDSLKQSLESNARRQDEQLNALQQQTAANLANAMAIERASELANQQARFAAAEYADKQRQAATDERLRSAEDKLKTLSSMVNEALALSAKELFLANGKEAFSVILTDDKVMYPQNDPNLDPRDAAKLSDLATKLGKLDQEYHLDIQGHTANTSTDDNNYNLGKARAEVVKRHLHEKQGISLNRMSTLSYGANKPMEAGANGNSNRRILIRVLVLK